MSRQELAEAVNAHLFYTNGIHAAVEAHYVGRLERGKRRRPTSAYREAFRAVLGVSTDADIGFGAADGTATATEPFPAMLSPGPHGVVR